MNDGIKSPTTDAGESLQKLGVPSLIFSSLYITLSNYLFNSSVGSLEPSNVWSRLGFIKSGHPDQCAYSKWEFGVNGVTHPLKVTICPIEHSFSDIENTYNSTAEGQFFKPTAGVEPSALTGMLKSTWGGDDSIHFDAGIFLVVGVLSELSKGEHVVALWHGYDHGKKQYVLCIQTETQYWIWSVFFTDILPIDRSVH